jgi:hypothetical protein
MATVENPSKNLRFQAVVLRGHLRLLLAGMRHSTLSGTRILASAAELTGKQYKRGQYTAALDDIQRFIAERA